ncbi:MAG: sugar transferase, partial [Leptolyngbyaceae cyanobacterium]
MHTASPTSTWSLAQWHQAEHQYLIQRSDIRHHFVLKRWLDLILAGTGIIAIAPLLLLIAIAVRLSSPGPIFFIQERLGRYGQPFRIYKFRTMVDGAVHLGA